jgi:hypothetical protein
MSKKIDEILKQAYEQPNPVWDLFVDEETPPLTIPMKATYAKIKVNKAVLEKSMAGTSMNHWLCGCSTSSTGELFACVNWSKRPNQCYRRRQGG